MKAPQARCTLQNVSEDCSFSRSKRLGAGEQETKQKPALRPALQTSDQTDDRRLRNKTGAAVRSRRSPIHSVSTGFFCKRV
jgi:hypothetical protein